MGIKTTTLAIKAHNAFSKIALFSSAIACLFVFVPVVHSSPTGGEITAGSGNIQTPDAQTTIVNQNSSSLSINWESLNLAADELLQFKQPGRDAVALNNILDQNATSILGQINANGRVFLMNPNGIIFGESARINVAGLVAGAFQMDNNFLNSSNVLSEYLLNIGDGEVINNGLITALNEGSVALVGNQVVNNGSIVATLGKVHLLSASEAALSFDADGMIQFSVSKEALQNPDGSDAAINNSGDIQANGGYVVLEGHAANGVYANVVNNSGVIQASRISNEGGVIRLLGTGGVVANSGELSATGGENSTGGSISLYGDRVGVFDGSDIDASGEQGGGNIYIGGQLKGSGEHTAEFTQVAKNTDIKADAITSGDGGEIIVWADDSTWAYGDFSATGGAQSGDGGFIEISGKQGLVMDADIDVSAPNGQAGTILFDPFDITIHDAADGDQPNDDGAPFPDLSNATAGIGGAFNISETELEALGSTANIILEATNDITLNNLADNILTLDTDNFGSVTFTADTDGTGGGDFFMDAGDTISTANGGAVTISGDTVTLGTIITDGVVDGNITVSSKGSLSIATADAGTGNIALTINNDTSADADSLTITGSLTGNTIAFDGTGGSNVQLIGKDSDSAWGITSADGGTYLPSAGFSTTATFTNFSNLVGGTGVDTFTLNGGTISGSIDGGAGTADVLVGDNSINAWNISGANSGTATGVAAFSNIENLTGSFNVDTFTLNGGSISGTINGGGDLDELIGNTGNNTWNITGADDAGDVTSVTAFSSIENLTGNSGIDTFTFANGIILTGDIDGSGGSDSVDKSAEMGSAVDFYIGGTGPDGYTNIETFTGSANVTTSIYGEDINSTWTINGDGAGQVVGTVTSSFTDIDDITGGIADDDFTFSTVGKISGTLDGGAGAGIDTLTANNEVNTWTITGADTGTVSGNVTSLYSTTFQDIENLTGNGQVDAFNFNDPGTISGIIDGSTASDIVDLTAKTAAVTVNLASTDYTSIENFLGKPGNANELQGPNTATTWNIDGINTGDIDGTINFDDFTILTGNASNDSFIFAAGGSISGNIEGGGTGSDTLTADSAAISSWNIDGNHSGTLTGISTFSGIENLVGGTLADSFIFGAAATFTGTINGLAGYDTVNYSALAAPTVTLLKTDDVITTEGLRNIDLVIGNNADSILTVSATADNTWTLTDGTPLENVTSTSIGTVEFQDFDFLTGSGNIDIFNFTNGAIFDGLIDGGVDLVTNTVSYAAVSVGTVDVVLDTINNYKNIDTFTGSTNVISTLTGENVTNTWNITGADQGDIDTNSINFVNFQNLTGGTGVDNYVLNGGYVTGTIDGGTGVNTLTADSSDNAWTIIGANQGNVDDGTNTSAFDNIENITGNAGVDTFTFTTGSISGIVDGGAGGMGSVDVVNLSALATPSITLGSSGYYNIESFIGNGTDSTLIGDASANVWKVTGVAGSNDGEVSSALGYGSETGVVSFTDFTSLQGMGNDELQSSAGSAHAWNITDAGNNLDGGISFSGMDTLRGNNTNVDTFAFSGTATFGGLILGGTGASVDVINYAGRTDAVTASIDSVSTQQIENFVGNGLVGSTLSGTTGGDTWELTAADTGQVNGINFSNFKILDGASGSDSLEVNNGLANIWTITAQNDGSVAGTNFLNIENLIGEDIGDTFTITDTSANAITGTITGGTGSDTIQGPDVAIAWTLSGINSGDVNGSNFTGIENLDGGIDDDTFTVTSSARVTGSITGGGGAGTDSLDLIGAAVSTEYDFLTSDSMNITITDGSGPLPLISVLEMENVNDSITASDIILNGTLGVDSMTLAAGGIAGTNPTIFTLGATLPVEFSNKTNVTIDGKGSLGDQLTGAISANDLILNDINIVGTDANDELITNINSLQINGPISEVYILEQDGLSIDIADVSSVLDIQLVTGDIIAPNSIITSAASTFTVAGGNSITLSGSNNKFTGSLAFESTGTLNNVTLVNTTPVDLQALTLTGDLSITATGDITQSGALSIGGDSSFSTGSNAITLNNAGNDFIGSVSLQNAGANNVAISDLSALSFGNSSIGSGALNVTADSIAQTGSITQQANAGATTFTANAGSIILDNTGNDFTGTVALTNNSASDTSITESDHLALGSSTTSGGNLTVTAANGVTLTGTTASNNGDIEITASTGDILLGKLNAGSGKITLNATTNNVFGDSSPIEDPNLTANDLVIISGQKTGEFNNPIAVGIPSNGTGFFTAGINAPQIIGFDGVLLPGSDEIYNEDFISLATNKRQNFSYSPIFTDVADGFYFSALTSYADGGLQMPDYTAVADAGHQIPFDSNDNGDDEDEDHNFKSGLQNPYNAKADSNIDLLIPEGSTNVVFDPNALPPTAAGDDSSNGQDKRRLPLLFSK